MPVTSELDAVRARRTARELALQLGFSPSDVEAIVIATSELAINLARYASGGTITLAAVEHSGRRGLRLESHDSGPGISDLAAAQRDGFSTGGGLGGGLGGVRRLMDELTITSSASGTHAVATKWLPADTPGEMKPVARVKIARRG
ncbi:MAG: hypothetical protein AVDCRST_MAG77-3528 [uncultured Chloroflexi bacterium]|uniref:Histidine kinase/HSP90-like ATPase domain-containing protein n=1 Tax=uncultured Chloroflexota bacterium TaxID=166587 RepID=A0A6J4JIF6_9CHLR|nr:MAG: hypothetical protein AVDCRST_MAG77-3528 [uncultured Chloroflexota bacterium]